MKNRVWYIVVVLILSSKLVNAQEKTYREPGGTNNWFVELGGSAFFYSLNYEKTLAKENKWGWVGRIGASYFPTDYMLLNKVDITANTFIFPFTTSLLYGGGKEKLEVGAGFSLLTRGIADREFVPTAVLGFRVIETNKVFFRVNYTPFIRNGVYTHWYGVSLGRNFSTK